MITYKYENKNVVIISEEIAEKYKDKIIETDWCGRGLIDVADLKKADKEYTKLAVDDGYCTEEYLDNGRELILERIDVQWWLEDTVRDESIHEIEEFITADGLRDYVEEVIDKVKWSNIRLYREQEADEEFLLELFKENEKEKLSRIKKK